MSWTDDQSCLPMYSPLVQLKSLKRQRQKNADLKNSYAKTIRDDFSKLESTQFTTLHSLKHLTVYQPSEWYLLQNPTVHAHSPDRVPNGAAKFQGQSSNSALLTKPDLQQIIIHIFCFRHYTYAVSADIEVPPSWSHPTCRTITSKFFGESTQQLLCSSMLGILWAPKIRLHALTTH